MPADVGFEFRLNTRIKSTWQSWQSYVTGLFTIVTVDKEFTPFLHLENLRAIYLLHLSSPDNILALIR